jgi:hypothetical protein
MGDLLYLPTTYLPTHAENERIEAIQRQIDLWRAELSREHKLKGFNAGQIWLSRQRFHNGIRDHWKIYPGFRDEINKKAELDSSLA